MIKLVESRRIELSTFALRIPLIVGCFAWKNSYVCRMHKDNTFFRLTVPFLQGRIIPQYSLPTQPT